MSGTIFITGATAGIGAAAARRFAAEGWRVVATGRRAERLAALQAELGAERVHVLPLDMRDPDAVSRVQEMLPDAFGQIDLLLNNAGLAPPMAPVQSGEFERWREVIDTNVTGLVAITRALLPGLVARKGLVVNLSSVAATYDPTGGSGT